MSDEPARFDYCPDCEVLVIRGHWQGLTVRCRTVSIPHRDAEVLQRYGVPVWRIIIDREAGMVPSEFGMTAGPEGRVRQLRFYEWHSAGPPTTGRLYVDHQCYRR